MNTESPPRLIEGLNTKKNGLDRILKREPWSEEGFRRIVREMGLKITHQRLAILKALTSGRVHVTAQEVFEKVQGPDPEIGFATVYRFLRKLTEMNFVTEVRMGGGPARYELTPIRHHDHLTCKGCGRIVEFENTEIEMMQERVARLHKFQLTDHVLELYGFCERCHK